MIEILCEGHISERCEWCYLCKKDKYNVECPHYRPITIYNFDVDELQIRKEDFSDESKLFYEDTQ